jgi:hypothetical protein
MASAAASRTVAAMRRCSATIFGLALVLAGLLRGQDELGLGKMWTFERPPLAYLQREYGFTPDEQWLRSVRLASLRFGGGCSASFVSPAGLILTNHHCVRDWLTKVQGDRDLVSSGFAAKAIDEELRLPGLSVQQLVRTTEITEQIEAGVAPGDSPAAGEQRRKQNQERVLAEVRSKSPELRPQIVRLFQGAVWQLYEYRIYDDIRLVLAPELQAAHFGGDPDNFTYPRHAVDFAFCRAYVDGKPADTAANYFTWSQGPKENELVFVTGNPGSTQRLLTRAQLDYLAAVRYPRVRQMIDARIDILRDAAKQDSVQEKKYRTMILGLENGQKLYRGEHAALQDPQLLARKAAAEAAFRQRIGKDKKLQAAYGGLWEALAAVSVRKAGLDPAYTFHSAGGAPQLLCALALLDFAAGNRDKQKEIEAIRSDNDAVQRALFADHLQRAGKWLPAGDPWLVAVLDGQSPSLAAARLWRESRLTDKAVVAELLADGGKAIAQSDDLALRLARVLQPLIVADKQAWGAVEAEERTLGARLGQALFRVYGDEVSPDATFTLRFADGRVLGYDYNGTRAPWRTVFHGMFARAAEFDGVPPFNLPAAFAAHQDRIDMLAAVDFVCTVDTTGGNSGSPVIGKDRRLVGLLFDGNIESLANEFVYGERVERSVCVHPEAIEQALLVYDAPWLLHELRGK